MFSSNLMQYLPNAISMCVIILLGLFIHFIIKRVLKTFFSKKIIPDSFRFPLTVITRWVIIVIVALLSFQQWGFHLTSIWAALSALFVLVGIGFLAVWSVVNNAFCFVLLLMTRPFKIGDEVEIIEVTGGKGLRGKVLGINMFFTTLSEIHSTDNQQSMVQVPNNSFFQKSVRIWRESQTETQGDKKELKI
jgi:small-conductance mechanosensitive channel